MPILRSVRPLVLVTGALATVLVAATAVPAHADPVALSVSAASPVVTLPIGDGFHDTESLVVTASAAATAAVTLQRAGGDASVVAQALPLASGANPVTVPTAGLVAGTYTATVATTDGASASASFSVQALHAVVTKIALQRSLSTVFPVKDGYRDTVTFTATPAIDGPKTVKVTGTAKLTKAGRTAKSWKLHSGSNRLVWNGEVGSAVRPGTYVLTVQAKGPQGATRTARSSVTVSAKRLVTRTAVVSRLASSALSRFQPYDAAGAGTCAYSGPLVGCVGYAAANGAAFSVIVGGAVSVPKAVRTATAYARPEMRVGIHTTKLVGGAVWGSAAGTAHTTGSVALGTTAGRWLAWSGNPATASVFIGLHDDSTLVTDRITFTYRYRTLV